MRGVCWVLLGAAAFSGTARAQGDAGVDSAADLVRFEDGHTGETVTVPRAWLDEPPAARSGTAAGSGAREVASAALEPPEVNGDAPALATPRPTRWVTPAPRRCRRYRRRRFCDGPLRVPVPTAEQAALATSLHLGGADVARHLLLAGPRAEWVAAVRGAARRTLFFPVDGGHLWRGLRRARGRRPRHKGTDIGAPEHTPVRAVNDGLVVYAGNDLRGYGNLVLVVHADASVTFYAHLYAAWVAPGARVNRGQVIGEVGHTGLARGDHLHFEWRVAGHPRSPRHLFTDAPADRRSPPAPRRPQSTPEDRPAREPNFTRPSDGGTGLHEEQHIDGAPEADLP